MDSHINVTMIFNGQSQDLRIPVKIEVSHLIREIDLIFMHKSQRSKYQLRVVNKGLILDEGKFLNDYPVTTGDILSIAEEDGLGD